MTIVLQAEQFDLTFEGLNFDLGAEVVAYSTTLNYVDGNGNFYVNGNGDFYTTGTVNHYAKPITLDANLPDFTFEGWIQNG